MDGLDTARNVAAICLSTAELRQRRERNEQLVAFALPELETIYQQIAHTNSTVILTDADGVLLHRVGDATFERKAERVALQPGACWNERERGTNAIGTALTAARPVAVHGPEHYLDCNAFLTCAAAPIRSPFGEVIAALDVSGDQVGRQLHTLGLVRVASIMVENRLLEAQFDEAIYLYFHPRPDFLGTLGQGIAVFSADGRLLAANAGALTQWQLERSQVAGARFEALFDGTMEALLGVRDGAALGLREPGEDLATQHLPDDFIAQMEPDAPSGGESLQALTDAAMQGALEAHGGSVSAAARALGINRSTLYRRLRR